MVESGHGWCTPAIWPQEQFVPAFSMFTELCLSVFNRSVQSVGLRLASADFEVQRFLCVRRTLND